MSFIKKCCIENILYVPSLHYSLLSVWALAWKVLLVTFQNSSVSITNNGTLCAAGTQTKVLYTLDKNQPSINVREVASAANITTWNERTGHALQDEILQVYCRDFLNGLKISGDRHKAHSCESCILSIQPRTLFSKFAEERTTTALKVSHSNIHDPLKIKLKRNESVFVTFIIQVSSLATIFPIPARFEVFLCFNKNYCLWRAENIWKAKSFSFQWWRWIHWLIIQYFLTD